MKNKTQIHMNHSVLDVSPVKRLYTQKKQRVPNQKPLPLGPVWGKDALYSGPKKFKNCQGSKNLHGYRSGVGLEPLGQYEKNFNQYMSARRVLRNHIPTMKRKVLLNRLNPSKSMSNLVPSPVKAGKGVLNLSNSMSALQMERKYGLSLSEIKKSTAAALHTVIDPMVMINKQETEHEEIKKLFTNKGSYNNDSTDYPSAINYDYSYDGSSNISIPTGISSLEGEVYEELIERQKSRELNNRMSRERSRQKSRRDNRHRSSISAAGSIGELKEGEFHEIDDRIPESLSSMFKRGSTPIDLAHTRMSLKIVPKQKPTISVLSLISDFGVERRDFDRSGENMMMAKSNKGWGKGMSR
tara:strand:+ start:101 stop:1165 length:1065 start_codon:yes stop_codon:yes gene_type:complete